MGHSDSYVVDYFNRSDIRPAAFPERSAAGSLIDELVRGHGYQQDVGFFTRQLDMAASGKWIRIEDAVAKSTRPSAFCGLAPQFRPVRRSILLYRRGPIPRRTRR